MDYKIKLDIFEGPLDLLIYLIKKHELDIHDIPITLITEQYLEYLNIMQSLNLELAGEFLVMASTLMRIKSKTLLPIDENAPEEESEEDPRDELVQKLLEYMKFKEAAQTMRNLEETRSDKFTRSPQIIDVDEDEVIFNNISLFDLIRAFSKVLHEMPKDIFHKVVKDEFTVADKVHFLLHSLVEKSKVRFGQLFEGCKNKLEAITTFLALLELVRLKEVKFEQDKAFDDISISKNTDHQMDPLEQSGDAEYGQG